MPKKTEQMPDLPILLTVPRSEAEKVLSNRIEKGEELLKRSVQTPSEVKVLQKDYWSWDAYNTDLVRKISTGEKLANELRSFGFGGPDDPAGLLKYVQGQIESQIRQLESIRERLELFPEESGVQSAKPKAVTVNTSRKVFIVHGRDVAARDGLARFLTKLDLEPIILHEQANSGRTIIEKLEKNADVPFAVVLLTPDDVGGEDGQKLLPRARQNVVLELGYFVGRLGRDRVCALYKKPTELPSDLVGVVYVPLDDGGGWKLQLAKEIREAGITVDMNKAM